MVNVTEVWRAIPGFEGKYEVSDLGRVRSLDRIVERECRWGLKPFTWKGRILKAIMHRGYLVTKLGADKRQWRVHNLVALAFIGPRPDHLVVNHINGIKTDNRPENLEYITNEENVKHAYRTGLLSNKGEANGNHRVNRANRNLQPQPS